MNRVGRIVALCGLASLVAASVALARGVPINCTGGVCTGTSGFDSMNGSNFEDDIRGLAGDDALFGNGADDILRGGSGQDFLSEDDDLSEDRLLGGADDDYLEGGFRADVLRGGAGDERQQGLLRGAPGPAFYKVSMFGDPGNDTLAGGSGDDSMEGEEGRDKMSGGAGSDYLDAIDDDTPGARDKLKCGKGFDRFRARAEDDVADDCEKRVPAPPAPPMP